LELPVFLLALVSLLPMIGEREEKNGFVVKLLELFQLMLPRFRAVPKEKENIRFQITPRAVAGSDFSGAQ